MKSRAKSAVRSTDGRNNNKLLSVRQFPSAADVKKVESMASLLDETQQKAFKDMWATAVRKAAKKSE